MLSTRSWLAGREVASLTESTDRLCDLPYTMWLDVDGDGMEDLYFHECGGHGYLSGHGGSISFIDLGQWDPEDAPAVNGWWGTTIHTGGLMWIVNGNVALLLGLLGILRSVQRSRSRLSHAPDHFSLRFKTAGDGNRWEDKQIAAILSSFCYNRRLDRSTVEAQDGQF